MGFFFIRAHMSLELMQEHIEYNYWVIKGGIIHTYGTEKHNSLLIKPAASHLPFQLSAFSTVQGVGVLSILQTEMCLCWLIAVWWLFSPLPANFSLPGFFTACGGSGVRVSGGNCAAFVANRIIIGAGADSGVVMGPVEEIWRLASRQGCLLRSTGTWKCKNTLLKSRVPQREANYPYFFHMCFWKSYILINLFSLIYWSHYSFRHSPDSFSLMILVFV